MTKERRRELKELVQSLNGVDVPIDDCIGLDECIDKAFEADRYRWHDMSEIGDVPELDTNILVQLNFAEFTAFETVKVYSANWFRDVTEDYDMDMWKLTAWRYIEPFEGDAE